MADYAIPGADGLSLHHFYRAMAWLGEELPADRQGHTTPFAPRTVKDEIEEALFARTRDLFTDLNVVFMDTTSLCFTGAGGEGLGARGYSKDHRPDLNHLPWSSTATAGRSVRRWCRATRRTSPC